MPTLCSSFRFWKLCLWCCSNMVYCSFTVCIFLSQVLLPRTLMTFFGRFVDFDRDTFYMNEIFFYVTFTITIAVCGAICSETGVYNC